MKTTKRRALCTTSLLALSAGALFAQPVIAQQAAQSPEVGEEIVVTGSRIVRDGYEAPTPLTVVGEEVLQAAAPRDVADFVNTLPSVMGSVTPRNSTGTISSGSGGINALNLRGIGTARTLVLLDGQRSVPATQQNQVDVGGFPQGLISRVDIVTGGASAAYGSDALSGVVNFVLDKEFTGLKGEVSAGITDLGDGQHWKGNMAGGTAFGNGRGHALFSAEVSKNVGILGDMGQEPNNREWMNGLTGILTNPAYNATTNSSVPQYIVRPNVAAAAATYGGIITSGPLKGTAFGPGGTPYQFTYGLVGGVYMSGGDWRVSDVSKATSIDPRHTHQNVFTRVAYDVADNVNVYAQLSWDRTTHESYFGVSGELNTLIMNVDNAYLPESVRQRAIGFGLTQFTFGSWVDDLHEGAYTERTVNRYVVGAEGDFEMGDSTWNWDAYYQLGITRASQYSLGNKLVPLYREAIDAVLDPATGRVVCRVKLTNPSSACVPFNVFGEGVATKASQDYLWGSSYRYERFRQNVAAATLRGEPFSSWAGPVSIAVGAEHRKESVTGIADPRALAGMWYAANYRPTIGTYNVKEAFAETVVPLAKDESWAQALDLNAAVRATDYSTSGFVMTWKAGLTYTPIDDVRFRFTRSRDIRASNLAELFTTGIRGLTYVNDPFSGNPNAQAETVTTGNIALTPEKADTTGIGVVLTPTFLPGLSASVDYYNIKIKNAIGTVGTQQTIDNCFAGNTVFCSGVERAPVNGVVTIVRVYAQPFNFVSEIDRGIDFDVSYRMPLSDIAESMDGNLSVRFLATHYLKNLVSNGINEPIDRVGQNNIVSNAGLPSWRWTGTVTMDFDPVSVTLIGRGVSSGVFDKAYIECTAGCPRSTVTHPTIDNNQVKGAFYLDTNVQYKLTFGDAEASLFFNVDNAFDKSPPIVPVNGGLLYAGKPTNPNLYDTLGRAYRAGVRFRM